jgi:hypothetical protein
MTEEAKGAAPAGAAEVKADPKPAPEAPAAKPEPAAAKPEPAAAKPEASAKPPKAEAAAKSEPKQPRRLEDDEDPDGEDEHELLTLTSKALNSRMARASKREQKAIFDKLGVKDLAELEKLAARTKALEEQEEKRRRESLDEKARLAEDLKKLKGERDTAVREARDLRNSAVIEREEAAIVRLAEQHVKPRYVKYLLADLRDHLRTEYTAAQLKELSDDSKQKEKVLGKWFAARAADDPSWGKDYDPKAAAEAAEKDKRVEKVTNGADTRSRPAQGNSGQASGPKTFAPGKPNSYTAQEARAEAKRQGFNW